MSRDECPHGQLRRQCETCELIGRVDRLRNQRDMLLRQYNEAESRVAALQARIESAPEATLSHGNGELLVAVSAEHPTDWAGKTVRLLVEDEG